MFFFFCFSFTLHLPPLYGLILCCILLLYKPPPTQGTQSANPHNDYSQHFVDTGQRPQNFIRDTGLYLAYMSGLGPITKAWLRLRLRLYHDYQEWLRLRLQSEKADYDYDYDYKPMITIMIMITCSNEMFFKQLEKSLVITYQLSLR